MAGSFEKNLLRLDAIINHLPEAIVVAQDGFLVFVNAAMEKLLGYPGQELTSRPFVDFVHPADRQRVVKRHYARLRGEQLSETYDFRVVTRDNEERWMQISTTAFVWDRKLATLNLLTDVTRRKEQEEPLEHSNSLLKTTLEATADGILVVDRQGRWQEYNQKFLQLWGISAQLAASADDARILEAVTQQLEDPETFYQEVQHLYQHPEEVELEKYLFFKDGRVLQRYSQPQRLGEAIVGRVWSFRDISEQCSAQQALSESEERLRALINASPDIICFKNGNGCWLEANEANLAAFELQGIDVRGKTDLELARQAHPAYKEAFYACAESDERAWQHGRALRMEETLTKPDGSKQVYDLIKVPLFTERGKRKGLVVLGREITQRKRSEEAQLQLNQRLEQLVEQLQEESRRANALADQAERANAAKSDFVRGPYEP